MSEALEGEIVTHPQPVKVTKHDENIVQLLEAAFHNSFNITEACQYAGISRKTYYEWLADDDIFSYRMSVAQSAILKKAKQVVSSAIEAGDTSVALRVLQLRDPDFRPKAEVTNPLENAETREKIKGFLDDIQQHDPSSELATADGPVARDEVAQATPDLS